MSLLPLLTIAELALITPGPDLLLVLRQASRHGRREATLSALGISCGFAVHLSYCLLGFTAWLAALPHSVPCMQLAGGTYLLFLSVLSVKTADNSETEGSSARISRGSFLQGFLNNLCNPKVALFLLALFTAAGTTQRGEQLLLAAALQLECAVSWIAIAAAAGSPRLRTGLRTAEPLFTAALAVLGASLIVGAVRTVVLL